MPVIKLLREGVEQLVKFADDMPLDEIRTALQKKFTKPEVAEGINKLRMQRASDMGFDINNPVYHGTKEDFNAFDPDRAIGTQYWSTTDKAAVEAGEVGAQGKGVIKEMYQNIKNPASWEEYDKFGIDELIGRGYDGAALKEGKETTYIAFKPNQYRDVKADFDPKKASSSNLLASKLAPVAAGAGLLGTEEEAEASFIGQAAKTWSKKALGLAQDMLKAGKNRDEIWKATGDMGHPTYKGVDGKWRQEIDDSGFKMYEGGMGALNEKGAILYGDELIKPNPMFDAYPHLRQMRVKGTSDPRYGGVFTGKEVGLDKGLTQPQGDSIALHEFQHAVQSTEDFARGGNVDMAQSILQDADKGLDLVNQRFALEKTNYEKTLVDSGYPEAKQLYNAAWKMKEADRLQGYLNQYHQGGKLTDKRRLILGSGGAMNDVNFEHRMRMGINWSKRHRPQAEKDAQYAEYIGKSLQQVYKDLDPKLVEQVRGFDVKDPAKKTERMLDKLNLAANNKHGSTMKEWKDVSEELDSFLKPYKRSFEGDRKLYNDLAGEVESRTAQERHKMSMGERVESPPWNGKEWRNSPKQVIVNQFGMPKSKALNRAKQMVAASALAGSTTFADTMNTMSNEIPTSESTTLPENYQPPKPESQWKGVPESREGIHAVGTWMKQNLDHPLGGTWLEGLGDYLTDFSEGQKKDAVDTYLSGLFATLDVIP